MPSSGLVPPEVPGAVGRYFATQPSRPRDLRLGRPPFEAGRLWLEVSRLAAGQAAPAVLRQPGCGSGRTLGTEDASHLVFGRLGAIG